MPQLNKQKDNTAQLHKTDEDTWAILYQELWTKNNKIDYIEYLENKELTQTSKNFNNSKLCWRTNIRLDKTQEALKQIKNEKVVGLDGINAGILQYRGLMMKLRLFHLLN